MAKMTDSELLTLVNSEFESAMGGSGGTISTERAKAWNYYLSKPIGNEVEGQSQVVTSDVSDVIDGMMPSLLRIFTTADNLVSFDAVGAEDERQSEQESDYVNHVFFKQNNAFEILYTWIFDALVQKNGIVKAFWDESETVTTETYEGLSEAEMFELLEDEELEPQERSERITETLDEQTGQLSDAIVHDIEFKRTAKDGYMVVENIPPEEYRISSDAHHLDPSKARMVGHERDISRSDLLAMGFDEDIVKGLAAAGEYDDSNEEIARRDRSDETRSGHPDSSQELINVREAYVKIDMDGKGRSELIQVFTAGDKLLSKEPADRQPFHVVSPQPLPHKHFGRATAEKVMDIQEITTTLTRQVLDNLYHTNNPGHGVNERMIGENTLDDLLTRQIGAVARFDGPMQEAYAPMTVPFTAGQSFPMLEWFDRTKRDRTGVNSDADGLAPEQLKNIQSSVLAQANDLSRMKIETVARIFAETGIKSLFLHIHELLLKHQHKERVVKLRGQWVPVKPSEWRTRRDMTVQIGLGIGSRQQNLLHLNDIWQKQGQMVENGAMGLTVTPRNIYNTAVELVKNANMSDPDQFFSDPGDQQLTPQASEQQQLLEQQTQVQQQQNELRSQKQQLDAEMNMLQERRQSQEMTLNHQRELAKMAMEREHNEDRVVIEMEKIANRLTELELQSGRDVPGSRV